MYTADKFNVQNNIVLVFESKGCKYTMHLLIENGLIRLENETNGGDTILFLGEAQSYTGEPVEPTEVIEEKPKRRKSKKKKQ